MAIPLKTLYRQFVITADDETLGELLERLPEERAERLGIYIVLPLTSEQYLVVRWDEIERIVRALDREARGMRLMELPGLPEPVIAVEQASTDEQGALALAQPGARVVVLSRGYPIGLLAPGEVVDFGEPDPFVFPESAMPFGLGPTEEDLTFAIPSPGERMAEALPSPADEPAVEERVINAWVEGLGPTQPLEINRTYELKFDVDLPHTDAVATAGGIDSLIRSLPAEQEEVEILVMIETDDFKIYGSDQQTLVVPREGRSANSVTFTIRPQKPGPGVIKALFIANNRVFQKMTMTLQVGVLPADTAAWSAQTRGMTMGSAMALPPRERGQTINLMIIKKEAGYQFIAQNGGVRRAFLNLSETQIAELIARAREDLRAIVFTLADNQYAYQQSDTSIPAEVHTATLKTLAKLGYYLYQKLFYAPGNGPDVRQLGDLLRQLSQQSQLHVEIVAERFIFPWALLYDRDPLDLEQVDPQGFWGFKHIVEYMPEFSIATTVNFNPQIAAGDTIGVGFISNTTIEDLVQKPVVQEQREFLRSLPGVSVSEHTKRQELYDLLNNPDMPAQLLYFYCHAVSNLPGDRGGVAGSKVVLSDGDVLLADLDVFAPSSRPPLRQAPLVFLNACQSAELSPYLYDGLVPYLVARGARGVIGTEVDTPALFAAEFAQKFLKRFLAGDQPLGELLLALRREYLTEKNNILGLLYALYSSGEVVVRRG